MHRHHSWNVALLSSLVGIGLAVSACGGSASPNPTGGSSTSPAAGTSGAGPTTPTGEFRAAIAGEPPSLDPSSSGWVDSITLIHQLYAGLIRFDTKGEIVPDIAKEIPSVSNGGISRDGKTYTFKLKDGLKWSDGKPLVAEDIAYALRRVLNPKTPSEYAGFFLEIKGAEAYNSALTDKQTDDATLAKMADGLGIKATDATTLVVELDRPRQTFLQVMGLWPAYPLRKDIIDAKGDKWTEAGNLIGNGPFMLTEWVHQDHMTLTPNPNFHGEKPKVAKISLPMVADSNANFAAYKAGERDLVSVPLANYKQVLADPTVKDELVRTNDLTTFAFQFNTKKAPFDNAKLRQAFSKAINRAAYVEKVSNGVGKPAFSWIPPGMPGYDPDFGKTFHAFDAAAAKKLLADAGFPDGKGLPQMSFQYANAGSNKTIAEFFQGQLKDNLGVDITLEPMETSSFSKAVNNYQFSIAFYGWGADYPDPDNWLPEVFGSKGGQNHTQYANPKFDEAAEKAAVELDETKRLALWKDAQKIIVEDTPIIFLIHRERLYLKKPYVKDLTTTGMDTTFPGSNFLTKIWLDK